MSNAPSPPSTHTHTHPSQVANPWIKSQTQVAGPMAHWGPKGSRVTGSQTVHHLLFSTQRSLSGVSPQKQKNAQQRKPLVPKYKVLEATNQNLSPCCLCDVTGKCEKCLRADLTVGSTLYFSQTSQSCIHLNSDTL